jgi:hypothetical protein
MIYATRVRPATKMARAAKEDGVPMALPTFATREDCWLNLTRAAKLSLTEKKKEILGGQVW